MGAQTAEAKRRVAEQRRAIELRMMALENRVRTDLHEAKAEFDQRTPRPQDHLSDVAGRIRERPLPYLTGALGAGVAIGMLSESARGEARSPARRAASGGVLSSLLGGLGVAASEDSPRGREREQLDEERRGSDLANAGGWIASMLAPQAMKLLEPAREELQDMLREAVRAFGNRRPEGEQPRREISSGGTPRAVNGGTPAFTPAQIAEAERQAEAARH